MYSYIYADRQVNHFVGHKTQEGIERLALRYIQDMIGFPVNPTIAQKEVIDALQEKNAKKAMSAWDYFARTELNQTVACHVIEPLVIVE
jgi:hypothetical protein